MLVNVDKINNHKLFILSLFAKIIHTDDYRTVNKSPKTWKLHLNLEDELNNIKTRIYLYKLYIS